MQLLKTVPMALVPYVFNLAILYAVFKNRKKSSAPGGILFFSTAIAAGTILAIILDMTQFVRVFMFCYIVGFCVLTMLFCKWVFQCNVTECLFLYFVIQSYLDDCMMVTKVVQKHCLKGMDESVSYFLCYGLLILVGILLFRYWVCSKLQLLVASTRQMAFWRYIWIMPVSFYLVYRTGITPQYITPEVLWKSADIVVPLLWTAATIICYFLVIHSLLGAVKQTEDKAKLETAENLLRMQKQQYFTLQSKMEETKRMRHDLRHQTVVLQKMADAGDIKSLRTYLQQYVGELDAVETISYCGHYIIDSILQYYIGQAEKAGITCSVEVKLQRCIHCDDIEAGIILGNLLENAVEACERQTDEPRFLSLQINTPSDEMTAIRLVNSCNGEIKRKGNGFLSAKRQFKAEGIGLYSVCKLVDKYHGSAQFFHDDHEFEVKVLF